MLLDMKTIFFSYVITDVVCTVFLVFLWVRNRQRFAGLSLWVVSYVMQVTSLLLILMRGTAPDLLSIVVANSLIMGGLMALVMGLERFVGKPVTWIPNAAFLSAFVLVHAYFTYVQPDLDARIINVSLGILVFSVQGAWLLFRRVDKATRFIARGVGMVLGVYCGVGLLRILLVLAQPRTTESLFESGAFDPIMVLIYQMLFIVATYSLAMMVNRRLIGSVRTQEERFRSMVEFSSDWDYWVGPDGSVLYTTPSCEALTGYRPQDFLQDKELRNRIVHPEDQAAFHAHEDEISATSGDRSLDCRIVNREGETRWINHVCRQVYDSGGRWLGRVASNRDVTERKRAEEALKQSERATSKLIAKLNEAQHVASIGSWEWNLETNQVWWSDETYRIFGVSNDFVPSFEANAQFIHPDDLEQYHRCFEHSLQTGEPLDFDCRLVLRDGSQKYCSAQGQPIKNDAGQLAYFVGTVLDITGRKRAEDALRESETLFRLLFHDHSAVKFIIDPKDGRIVDANKAAAKFYGWSREQLLGMKVQDLNTLPPQEVKKIMESVRSEGRGYFEFQHRRAHGTIVDVAVLSGKIDIKGKPLLHSIVQDISKRRQAEEEREKLHAQLLQAQKMESVGRLAGGVAHDFNNKLSVILGYTQLALDGMDREDPLYATLQQVLKAGNQSVDIVRQLLAFARKQTIAPRVLDLNETIEGMLKMLRRLIGEDIDLVWEPGGHLRSVKMDPSQVDQILANLCVNARDAISGVGKVTIETENVVLDENYCADRAGFVPGDYVMLGVSDSGCGMDKETVANAFEPFFTTKGVGKGTGLGLSTVYGIVKQNQGFVNIYSEPGKGTSVKVYLPPHSGGAEQGIHEVQTEVPRGRGETILVVEDAASVLGLAWRILETLGYDVMTSASPETAVEMAREHVGEIHLLLTDVVLPEMNGKDLAMTIKKMRPGIRTLYMSGYTADVIAHHGVLDDRAHFVEKPFTPQSLGRKVREAIDSEKGSVETKEGFHKL